MTEGAHKFFPPRLCSVGETYKHPAFFVRCLYHAWRLNGGVVHGTPWLQNCSHSWSAAQVPHTARWLLAAGGCRSIRCNGGAGWAPRPSPHHPSCSLEETFSVDASHFPKFRIPSQPTRPFVPRPIYPCDTACNPHPTFRSTVFPAAARHLFSPAKHDLEASQTSKHPLRQALYLDSPPSSASLVHHIPSATLGTHQHKLSCNLQPWLHVNINIFFTSQ